MPPAIRFSGAEIDLSPRLTFSAAVVASPALNAETIIAQITLAKDVALQSGIIVVGYAAYLVGASGSAVQFRIRRTDVSGTAVKASGALNVTAADLRTQTIVGVDTGISPLNAVYCLTMIVTAGGAESTVSAVTLAALVV
jgi:hypothetical protein